MLIKYLKWLYTNGKISRQQYKTFKGQVIANDAIGCIRGLERAGLITPNNARRIMKYGDVRW